MPYNGNSGDDVMMITESSDLDKLIAVAQTYTLDAVPAPGDWT